ncbi:ferritin family protein [Inconstantimicrobium mannanitabidum]|uniref:Uncharacterized protein n=1 Tax=Inconstantimicrobium mannanitabidum TaxID=1604901 RepID=A0ACB5RHN4_9CLOT|nr:ferritin family protein [Clostridium sp. TW13]GKX68600.1 hypothetical protein rsdtw13_38580 [Clostridium sp. TW13]
MKNQKKLVIETNEKIKLIKSQQGELDAVILYKKLSAVIKETEYKEIFLKIAADEGKHAGILRSYTQENLKPKGGKAAFIIIMYKVLGLKFTLRILSKGEIKAANEYAFLVNKFHKINEIMKDEQRHGELMRNMYM